MEAGELAGVCVDSNRPQKISAAQGNHRAGSTVCVMAVGGKSALHSAGDVAQSEMEAQRVLACVSTAKCAKCQKTRKRQQSRFFSLVGLWWLTVVVPLLVSHIKGNEEKAIYSQLQSRL